MEDQIADKRRARNPDDFLMTVEEVCKKDNLKEPQKLSKLKAILSRVTGGKDGTQMDKTTHEVTLLALGRDTAWKKNQVEIMRSLHKAITKSRLEGKVFGVQWCNFVNKCVQGDVLNVANFLFQLRLSDHVIEQDYYQHGGLSINFDPWDSVHFYTLDVIANVVISSFWDNSGSKRFLKNIISTGTFEKVLKLVEAPSSERFLTTCLAVYLVTNVCIQSSAGDFPNLGLLRAANILPKLAHFIHKDNTIKMATEWFQNGVEQFEFDALAERPDGLAVMSTEAVFNSGCQEMTRGRTLQAAINWALSLQHHAFEYLATMCLPKSGYAEMILQEKSITKPLVRWLSTPVFDADVGLMVQGCLRVICEVAESSNVAFSFLQERKVARYLELGVYSPNAGAVSNYLEIVTKLSRCENLSREIFIKSENFCRAAILNLYCLDEAVNIFSLAYLQIVTQYDAPFLLKNFPLHEISLFKEFFYDKTDAGLNVSDLTQLCIAKLGRKEYDKRLKKCPPRIDYDVDASSALKDEGNKYFKENKFKKAIEKYTQAIAICPPTVKVSGKTIRWNILIVTLYCNRAQCYIKDDQYQKAVQDCDIAIARSLGAAERLKDFDNELFKKAVYRRSLALFHLEEYERAAIDIGECVVLEQERKEFRAHKDKVVMMCRQKHGYESIRKCIECDGAKGLPLKKCPHCPALYCSRVCQLEAWRHHHRVNCSWFTNKLNQGSKKNRDKDATRH